MCPLLRMDINPLFFPFQELERRLEDVTKCLGGDPKKRGGKRAAGQKAPTAPAAAAADNQLNSSTTNNENSSSDSSDSGSSSSSDSSDSSDSESENETSNNKQSKVRRRTKAHLQFKGPKQRQYSININIRWSRGLRGSVTELTLSYFGESANL